MVLVFFFGVVDALAINLVVSSSVSSDGVPAIRFRLWDVSDVVICISDSELSSESAIRNRETFFVREGDILTLC